MQLSDLINACPEKPDFPAEAASLTVLGITADSRKVRPGWLFAALGGMKADGAQFIASAKAAGAIATLCSGNAPDQPDIPLIRSGNPRRDLAFMAAKFYSAQPRHMVAVTGTDGKTSTADFFRQLWHLAGQSSASIGTLGVLAGSGEELYPGTHTTPDPVELHRQLAELAQKQVDYVCMEASSHGIHQHRLDGVTLQAGAFTNIARDHLDYHGTEEAYFEAKAGLFERLLPEGATAVINADDARFAQLAAICERRRLRLLDFGKAAKALKLVRLEPLPHGQRAQAELLGSPYALDIPLVGAFQAMNILAALGLALGCGGNKKTLLDVIPRLRGVPGRLELAAQLANGAAIYVDYAHTPMALANILRTLRPHTQGRLHVVFGCGGDRDAGKRPEMGRIAADLADSITVTDDNPRSEDPALIRRAILAASPGAKEVADRKDAIYGAVKNLEAGDILVIAGKGHEKTQIMGSETLPFDDVRIARAAVEALNQ